MLYIYISKLKMQQKINELDQNFTAAKHLYVKMEPCLKTGGRLNVSRLCQNYYLSSPLKISQGSDYFPIKYRTKLAGKISQDCVTGP